MPTAARPRRLTAGYSAPFGALAFFLDLDPPLSDFRQDVLAGLAKSQKRLSPKYFYDAEGSKLFETITTLDAYYLTRTERRITLENAREIGEAIGPSRSVFEYGSGASEKIRQLLALMDHPRAYVAVDISRDHLIASASALAEEQNIPVGAICADFGERIAIPDVALGGDQRWLGYFPGSTIGNLSESEAAAFLGAANETLGPGSMFLLGADLEKDPRILARAYDDPEGVTAAFNLNVLKRMQRELGARLDIDDFEHVLRIEAAPQRVEMHLRALRPTAISVAGRTFAFRKGETLHTENSHKFALGRLLDLAASAGWRRRGVWTDERGWFATCLFSNS